MPTIVKVKTEKELADLAAELIHIMINMRFSQKYWHEHFGAVAKQKKQSWEKKADDMLTKLGFTEHQFVRNISIIKDEKQA